MESISLLNTPLSTKDVCDKCIDESPVYKIVDSLRGRVYYLCRDCKKADKKLRKIRAR
jgi:hypothetical protein